MKLMSSSTAALVILLAGKVHAATYILNDTFQGNSFFTGFSFLSEADPTNGRVNYVNEDQARSRGLATVNGTRFILRADDTTKLSPGGNGRDSFRIRSDNKYDTHVSVYDVQHMPQGCGTAPGILELGEGSSWPDGGMVNIVDGANDQVPNTPSLYTTPECTMPPTGPNRIETGIPFGLNCNGFARKDTETGSNTSPGCGVQTTIPNNYGPEFNNNEGGWYAMERTSKFIKVWFWPRHASNVPPNVHSSNSSAIDTDAWGEPTADFPATTECDIDSKFSPANIIIDLTFCGEQAGGDTYANSGCPAKTRATCEDFVNNNPDAFSKAYFELNSVRVFKPELD